MGLGGVSGAGGQYQPQPLNENSKTQTDLTNFFKDPSEENFNALFNDLHGNSQKKEDLKEAMYEYQGVSSEIAQIKKILQDKSIPDDERSNLNTALGRLQGDLPQIEAYIKQAMK